MISSTRISYASTWNLPTIKHALIKQKAKFLHLIKIQILLSLLNVKKIITFLKRKRNCIFTAKIQNFYSAKYGRERGERLNGSRLRRVLTLNRITSSILAILPSLTHVWKKLGATLTPRASLDMPVPARSLFEAITRNVPNSNTINRCVYTGNEPINLEKNILF